MHVGHIAGIACVRGRGVSGRGVGGGVVGGGGIGWRVRGVEVWGRLRVGWDGNVMNATTETAQGEIGQDAPGGDREE